MAFIYLASPYTSRDPSVLEERYYENMKAAHNFTVRGLTVYSPVVHFHHMARVMSMPQDFAFWQFANRDMLEHAHALYILTLDGWDRSRGVTWEREYALELEIPVYHIDPSTRWTPTLEECCHAATRNNN